MFLSADGVAVSSDEHMEVVVFLWVLEGLGKDI